jgi:hypothetical protein
MITVITNIKPTKKLDIEELIIFVLKILNVDNVSIAVSYNKEICDNMSTKDIQINALLDKTIKENHYNLILREKYNAKEIICHEMVHLKQYHYGELYLNKNDKDNYFIWKNNSFPTSIPYEDRPWEAEALRLDHKLLKQYKK